MESIDRRSSINFLFILVIIITIFAQVPLSYADRTITIRKVSDVSEESLLHAISNMSKYPEIFPDNVKYVKLLDNNTKLVEMNAGINGFFFDTQATCKTDENGNYFVEVVSGDLKGTTIAAKMEKTWGFNGEKDGGTITTMTLDLKTSGFLSWIVDFVPSDTISQGLEYGLDKFVSYSNT